MTDPLVGINLPDGASTPQALEAALDRIVGDGFETVELGLDLFPLIIGGEVMKPYVEWMGERLRRHPLRRSAHIGRNVDLRAAENQDLQMKVLLASIDICAKLSMSPLTLHFEVESGSIETEERFYEGHRRAAYYAAERGVRLCIENIEVERVEPVVRMVRELRSSGLGMTFDFGHAFLASRYFGFDFIESIREALPFIEHLHMSGNTGVFEILRLSNRPVYDSLPLGYRMAFGRGDIHAPPLWGTIPYDRIFPLFAEYEGVYLCEYYSDLFLPFNRGIQEEVRREATGARGGAR